MKKIILLFLALISLSANAQKIDMDKQDADGSRLVATTRVLFAEHDLTFVLIPKKDKRPSSIDLQAECFINKDGDRSYFVDFPIFYYKHEILVKKGSRLLFKFDNDSIMEVKSSRNVDEINNDLDIMNNKSTYSAVLSYELSPSQVDIFRSHKVIKMRLETDLDYLDFDSTYYDERFDFSGKFIKCINAIDKELTKSNDLYNGF
mgnify:CR=1 FL=1